MVEYATAEKMVTPAACPCQPVFTCLDTLLSRASFLHPMPDLPAAHTTNILTERLLLRPFTLEDAEVTHRWFSDPEVMRYIPGGPDASLEDTRRRIERYLQHEATHGFTKWLVTDRHTGEPLGDGGLYTLPNDPRVELGFRFAREHWGRGYALEMARAWVRHFAALRPGETIYGIVLPEHARSQRVLEKLGFEPAGEEEVYGRVMKVYRICNPTPGPQN